MYCFDDLIVSVERSWEIDWFCYIDFLVGIELSGELKIINCEVLNIVLFKI